MSIMLEKITVGVVPSSLVRKARMTERILGDVVTGLQDAIGRVYGNRAGFISDSTPNGDRSYLFGLSMVRVSYEVHGITRGDVQAKVTVEGSQGLDPQPTGTFLRAMLESLNCLKKMVTYKLTLSARMQLKQVRERLEDLMFVLQRQLDMKMANTKW